MAPLPSELRNQLEQTVVKARDAAEEAARTAVTTLAVARDTFFPAMTEDQKALRRALRAKARQLGGGYLPDGMVRLVEEIAYEQWHRMLFARYLAENNLLMHPEGVPVTLAECEELAPAEGAVDGWELAARYASQMLPGLFNAEDPAVQVRFAPEGRRRLEALLADLPAAVFTADDSLGWVYQFWQTKKKAEVNSSERKIGGADLYPVTQLFTEDYMVRFLLENSLGAWWAARHPDSPLIGEWTYLRWRDEAEAPSDGATDTPDSAGEKPGVRIPAAGAFPGWPARVAEVTVMDPCGGSGHFILVAFEMLRRMRMEAEGLGEREAADAVLRDNLFMLEIDPRCAQIATFALALAAWKAGDYRELPVPHIACSGIAVEGQLEDWLKLAGDDERLRTALERLYELFKQAPTLGSLINPAQAAVRDGLFSADYAEVAPLLERALAREKRRNDPAAAVLGEAARGVLKAARLLAGQYTLVATNVPYLTRGSQGQVLMDFCSAHYPSSKSDLSTTFIERCRSFAKNGGAYAIITPENWLFLSSYNGMRQSMLVQQTWHHVVWLGAGAFKTIGGEVVKAVLLILSNVPPVAVHQLTGIDVSSEKRLSSKIEKLLESELRIVDQSAQLNNPDARLILVETSRTKLLQDYAHGVHGLGTKASPRFIRYFWEVSNNGIDWEFMQSSVKETTLYGGMQRIVFWQKGEGILHQLASTGDAILAGSMAHGKPGVLVSQVGSLSCTLYQGGLFEKNAAVVLPHDPDHVYAIWQYCKSPEYSEAVRQIDRKIAVTNSTLVKVPFDLDHWQSVAEEQYPDGLPDPYSNDATQWLFAGHPVGSSAPLQVVVARLLGYCWPENNDDDLGPFADVDGIVCLPPLAGEQPAHERLRALLAHAYNHPPALDHPLADRSLPTGPWSLALQEQLLTEVEYAGKGLDDWLRDGFFIQHCRLFGNRPFIWHIWDGRRDGFSALVNYHRLDAATLDKLIYTYLGAWITTQEAAVERGEAGADGRLAAALELKTKLEAIREGEPPHDIYVRWKALHEQPIGWNPDLNDGVRLNIRPFVEAGVLRRKFSINWNKDRGKNPDGSERINDRHYTRAEKLAARQEAR